MPDFLRNFFKLSAKFCLLLKFQIWTSFPSLLLIRSKNIHMLSSFTLSLLDKALIRVIIFCYWRCLSTFSPILRRELKAENITLPTVLFPVLLLPAITVIPRNSNSACLIFDILSMTSFISIILSTNPAKSAPFTCTFSRINYYSL